MTTYQNKNFQSKRKLWKNHSILLGCFSLIQLAYYSASIIPNRFNLAAKHQFVLERRGEEGAGDVCQLILHFCVRNLLIDSGRGLTQASYWQKIYRSSYTVEKVQCSRHKYNVCHSLNEFSWCRRELTVKILRKPWGEMSSLILVNLFKKLSKIWPSSDCKAVRHHSVSESSSLFPFCLTRLRTPQRFLDRNWGCWIIADANKIVVTAFASRLATSLGLKSDRICLKNLQQKLVRAILLQEKSALNFQCDVEIVKIMDILHSDNSCCWGPL